MWDYLHGNYNKTPGPTDIFLFCSDHFCTSSRTTSSSPNVFRTHTPMSTGCSTHNLHHNYQTQCQLLGWSRTHSDSLQISWELAAEHFASLGQDPCTLLLQIWYSCAKDKRQFYSHFKCFKKNLKTSERDFPSYRFFHGTCLLCIAGTIVDDTVLLSSVVSFSMQQTAKWFPSGIMFKSNVCVPVLLPNHVYKMWR